jgi:HTH-type transcriptional regulator, competence development regulator
LAKALGDLLKEARVARGLSLRDVERATGIRNAHLSQIENHTIVKPEMAMLWELATLYGLDYTDLLAAAGLPGGTGESSGRQRRRMSVAMRAMGELTPAQQDEALRYMAELRTQARGEMRDDR